MRILAWLLMAIFATLLACGASLSAPRPMGTAHEAPATLSKSSRKTTRVVRLELRLETPVDRFLEGP